MSGLLSPYVELPGSIGNHHDFQFPWNQTIIATKTSGGGTNGSKNNSKAMKKSSANIVPDFVPPPAKSDPVPLTKVPTKNVGNDSPTKKESKKAVLLKKSLKHVTGFVKQKIISLEEMAYSNSMGENVNNDQNVVGSSKTFQEQQDEEQVSKNKISRNHSTKTRHLTQDFPPTSSKAILVDPKPRKHRDEKDTRGSYKLIEESAQVPDYNYEYLVRSSSSPRENQTRRKRREEGGEKKKENRRSNMKQEIVVVKEESKKKRADTSTGTTIKRSNTTPGPGPATPEKTKPMAKLVPVPVNPIPDENLLSTLKRFKTVFLLDDSSSMAQNLGLHWNAAVQVLLELAAVAVQYDTDGIDLEFLHSKHHIKRTKSVSSIVEHMKGIRPIGDSTPTETKAEQILSEYIEELGITKTKKPKNRSIVTKVKPLNLVIITDGIPDDLDTFITVIRNFSAALDMGNLPLNQIGIQFVQIGSDRRVTRILKFLDDHLQANYGVTRDMIDTTQYTGRPSKRFVMKCLLGGINRRIDRMEY